MKKLSICFFAAWLISVMPGTAADQVPESCLLFSITSGSMARLGVVNTDKLSASLRITNKQGHTFLNQSISGNSNFFKIVDLKKMPDGEYTVTLNAKGNMLNREFKVSQATAAIIKAPVRRPPRFKMVENSSLIISYHNDFKEMVNVFFLLNDEVVFEDRGMTTPHILKRYPLEKLPRGNYTIQLYSDGKIYDYSMILE